MTDERSEGRPDPLAGRPLQGAAVVTGARALRWWWVGELATGVTWIDVGVKEHFKPAQLIVHQADHL